MLYDQKIGSTFCRLAFAAHNIRIESMREGAKEVQIDAAARSDLCLALRLPSASIEAAYLM